MRGFTLLEIIIYIGILSFILTSSNIIFYSYLETTQKVQQEITIEKTGLFLLQRLEQDIISHIPIMEPYIDEHMPISDFSVTSTSIQHELQKIVIEFYIKDHFFTLTHLTDIPNE